MEGYIFIYVSVYIRQHKTITTIIADNEIVLVIVKVNNVS